MKRRTTIATAAALTTLALLAVPATANAAQHQNAYYYSHWTFAGSSTGYWNVDQDVSVEQKAQSTYWAQLWNWKGSDYGGYVGLQTNGNRGNDTTGDTAIFSLWNASAANGPHCGTFDGEGNGWSCRLAYPFAANRLYRYRVWRLNADSAGQWWGAWIQDTTTGKETYIGSIRVAKSWTLMTNVQNFVEYFGTQMTCTAVPKSRAVWTQPAANSQGNGHYQYGSSYLATPSDRGNCTGGSTTPVDLGWTKGVRVTLGG
jgi:hypothetical protein